MNTKILLLLVITTLINLACLNATESENQLGSPNSDKAKYLGMVLNFFNEFVTFVLLFYLIQILNENNEDPEVDEFEMLKRKYRYGKRSAMPYRFGRKRSWQSADKSEISALKNLLKNSGNSNEDLEDLYSRAMYRYGRK